MRACRFLFNVPILALGLVFAMDGHAECTDAKIRKLSKSGLTIAKIAKQCEMERDDVKAVLDEDTEAATDGGDGSVTNSGLPKGTPLGACGCWGPVDPGYRQGAPQCRSGYAVPQACPQVCPAGGYAWHGVCG